MKYFMPSSIGKILSEKRLELGLSLEEVADATKIRVDYLESIEQERWDFDLPHIYKRGFVKTYAEYLELDLQEIMEICPIPGYEALASNEKRREMVSTVARKQAAYVAIEAEPVEEEETVESSSHALSLMKKVSRKAMLSMIGAVVIVFLLLAGILFLSKKSIKVEENTPESSSSFEKIAPHREILLRAKGNVKLIVRDRDSKERIYTGSLKDGEERYIEYERPVQIYYDKGELLSVEMANGEILHPEKGRGGVEIK
jgi:cytoskeletal protein RodZ